MNETTTLSDVLKLMRQLDRNKQPIPFSISVRTFNRQNGSGGRLTHYRGATLMQAPKTPGVVRLSQQIAFKNPNHWENRTRNIKTSEGIKTIHILYIIEFNGKKVIL